MRRAIARGRILPQSLSTDPRYGRLSLKAQVLYPLLWVNADDQGRLPGDPDEVKYAACPNIRDITAEEIPSLLEQMETKGMIQVYTTSKTQAIQMLDWWEVQRLQWAYPSPYPPPEGWQDRLRYHASPTQIVKENWPSRPNSLPSALPNSLPKESSPGKKTKSRRTPLPSPENEKEGGKGKRRGRGNLPSALGSRSPPSPAGLSTNESEILQRLTECFRREWGRVPAKRPHEVISRVPNARESAQLRDLAKELSAGGCPLETIEEVFRHVAGYPGKMHISYLRDVLFHWLGKEKPP